jgi:hypothetical protein
MACIGIAGWDGSEPTKRVNWTSPNQTKPRGEPVWDLALWQRRKQRYSEHCVQHHGAAALLPADGAPAAAIAATRGI